MLTPVVPALATVVARWTPTPTLVGYGAAGEIFTDGLMPRKAGSGKQPYMPWYYSDWLGSTMRAAMTPEQRSAYLDLLCHQWANQSGEYPCTLPADPVVLGRLAGVGEEWLSNGYRLVRECFPLFEADPTRCANPRLLEIWVDNTDWQKKSSLGGQKSAEKRWGGNQPVTKGVTKPVTKGQPQPQPDCNPPPPPPLALPSASSEPSTGSRKKKPLSNPPAAPSAPTRADQILELFDHYQLYHPQAALPRPPEDPTGLTKADLEKWTRSPEYKHANHRLLEGLQLEHLKRSIDGAHRSPHNCGANDTGRRYLGLELLIRDASRVNDFAELDADPPRPQSKQQAECLAKVRVRFGYHGQNPIADAEHIERERVALNDGAEQTMDDLFEKMKARDEERGADE